MEGLKVKHTTKKALTAMSKAEFDSLKASGMLWEFYPDAPESWDGIKAHTAGPWEVRPSSNKGNGTDWRDIVSMGTPFTPSYVGEALVQDALLIASAPEMKSGYELILERLATNPMQDDELAELCRTMINKTEGRS